MKILWPLFVLIYGALVTGGVAFFVRILDGLSGWGDGATHGHSTPALFWIPVALFFMASAYASFLKKKTKLRSTFWVSLVLLFISLSIILGILNALFVWVIVLVTSVIVWAPLLSTAKSEAKDQRT